MRFAVSDIKNFISELEYSDALPTKVTENLSDSVGAVLQRLESEGHTIEATTSSDFGTAFAYIAGCRAWERNFMLKVSLDDDLPAIPITLIDDFPTEITNLDLVFLMQSALDRVCHLWMSTSKWGLVGALRRAFIGTEVIEGVEKEIPLLFQMARIPLSICVGRDTVMTTMEGEAPCIKPE